MKKSLLLFVFLFLGMTSSIYAQACGGIFTDSGGANANYANNENSTITICPSNPGEKVTVTFTSFNTQSGIDALFVFNGNTTSATQIPSSSTTVIGGLAGGFSGATIPGPFTSTSADGCLTFKFTSNSSTTSSGWVANVTCAVPPTCPKPTTLSTSQITTTTATAGWQENGAATAWEIYLVPAGSPAPTDTTIGYVTTSSSSLFSALTPGTCYTFYVRSNCFSSDRSSWSAGYNFCTLAAPPVCGGQFVDSGGVTGLYTNNADVTNTICPVNAGDVVTVTFASFAIESNFDALYVFNGNSIAAPQITSANTGTNVPGGLSGGFWGTGIPGPFTSSSNDGCLTFRFRSDSTTSLSGWVANISCSPLPTCPRPIDLTVTSTTSDSALLSWTDTGSSSWEVIALPQGTAPSLSSIGQIVTTNPGTITGLNSGTRYSFYVRSNCNAGDRSYWSLKSDGATQISNDNCANAINISIAGHNCTQTTQGSLISATASPDLLGTCLGTADDDTWFKFTAIETSLNLALQNVLGTTTNLNFAVYSGTCGSLTSVYCSGANQLSGQLNNLTVGTTYYLRVYSNAATVQAVTFNICITTFSTCAESESICGVTNYANTTGIVSTGTIGCLTTSPNPTYFTLRISSTGPVNLTLTQATVGSSFADLDVDYAAWGPFTSPSEACAAIAGGQAPGIGVPLTTVTGCSFAASPIENLNIANAQAGQYYIILVTNYSDRPGYINIKQSNVSAVGAGSIDCSGIRLNAFLDSNANGTQDSGEPNFPLGQFHYAINNNANEHSIISSTGSYILYDQVITNLYHLTYTVNNDYAAQYNIAPGFTNVNVSTGAMTTYNFPITTIQNYNDLGVTIVPQTAPRAGSTYTAKIVYTNNGTLAIPSGTLTFSKAGGTTITSISQSGTTAVTNGFTFGFANLLPFESRSILVSMSVPSLPLVSLGQLLTNSVSVTAPTGDVVANNNNDSSSEIIIGSYDPNDKVEGHGEKILFSSFTANDYLEYTIRFENNGTAGALDIVVDDVLDNQLDENSLVMLASSHSYSLDRLGKNLSWNFKNIQLPVSIPNTDIGKGFIKFKIKPKAGFAIGDIIPNTAQIYFDSNPAIVTNTFNTVFVTTLRNDLFTENSIMIYPNPASNIVEVTLQNTPEIMESISIYDILGKKVSMVTNVGSNQSSVNVSHLSRGIYLLEILTENHLKQIKKLIIK